MEKNNKDLIKNIGISILVIIALILLITVVSYNKIAIGKVIPKVEEYQLDNEMKNELESDETDENSEIITTYEIDASDLKQYEKTKKYNKGKANPFAEESSSSSSENNSTTSDENSSSSSKSDNNNNRSSSKGFYDDDGTK